MKALKALVIGMGILIVVGIAMVGYALSRGKQKPHMQEGAIETQEPFKASVPVPPGWKLEQVTAAGDRIVLRFVTPDGERLTLLDAQTGAPAGTISLIPDTH